MVAAKTPPYYSEQAELLLAWMAHPSHQGEIRDAQLRSAVENLIAAPEERTPFRRTFLRRLRLMGFVLETPHGWRVCPPRFLLLPRSVDGKPDEFKATLSGARTPQLLAQIQCEAERRLLRFENIPLHYAPACIILRGTQKDLQTLSHEMKIPLIQDAPQQAIKFILPISRLLAPTEPVPLPTSQRFDVFDFDTLLWRPPTVADVKNADLPPVGQARRYGAEENRPTLYYVGTQRGALAATHRGEAVFMAAFLLRRSLCRYDAESGELWTPAYPPEAAARTLCLCSGRPPQGADNQTRERFLRVPPHIAVAVLKRLGQDFPVPSVAPPSAGRIFWLECR
jgi:hypothetical protein